MAARFKNWFERQHGKRPNLGGATDKELQDMVVTGFSAGRELEARRIYDARKTSALYAWNATTAMLKSKDKNDVLE